MTAAGRALLTVLVLVLPFEPRRPTLPLAGLEVTLLEASAALAILGLGFAGRDRLLALLRRPPLPLLFVSCYAGVHLASALLAEQNALAALKFAARMGAMAAFAWVVAAADGTARRRATSALVAAGGLVAVLAIGEGSGLRLLDPLLGHFRETPFNVGGARRATAGSEYPNQAAAFLMYALVAWAGVSQRTGSALALGVSAVLGTGLLFTYSRGALAAAGLALLLAWAAARRVGGLGRGPVLALVALASSCAVFFVSGEIFRLRLESEGIEHWYGARYEPLDRSLVLSPQEVRRARVRVTNTGRRTWERRQDFHLSYHWYDPARKTLADGGRTLLPADMPAGASFSLEAELVAPLRPGRYLLIWDMVHERTTWFSGQGVRPYQGEALVGASDAASSPVSPGPSAELGWRPGRAELWRIAFSMWQAHPVLGAGPDNFRWLYGRYAGQVFSDTRVFANNALLEAAATTGSLGALVLALTFAAALGAAYRRLAGGGGLAVGSFGLVAGVLIHGLVDYLLAFTGHYLFLGFLIGSISAPESDLA